MVSTLSARTALYGSYTVDPQALQRLNGCLSEAAGGVPSWSIDLSNGMSLDGTDLDVLLGDLVLETASVDRVWASVRGSKLSITVDLNRGVRPILFQISGTERSVVVFCDTELQRWARSNRKWWSFVRSPLGPSSSFSIVLPLYLGLFGLASAALVIWWAWQKAIVPPSWLYLTGLLQAAAITALATPSVVFRLGRGEIRWAATSSIVKFAIGTLAAGFLINWVSAIWNPFTR